MMKTSIIFKLIVFVTCLTCALRPSAQQQPRDSYYDPEITLVLIDKDSIEHFVDLQIGEDGDYTTTYTFEYNPWGEFVWDPALTDEQNEANRPNVPFYFLINGVRFGADEAMRETVLGYAMENPLEENAEGFYCVPVGFSYTLGVALKDGGYYVYAAIGYNPDPWGPNIPDPYTLYSNYDFLIDGFYYHKNGTNASITYNSIYVDVEEYWPTNHDYMWWYVYYNHSSYPKIVTIPEKVTYDASTYEVNGIDDYAFAGTIIQEITIPNTITEIKNNAFTESHIQLCNIVGQGEWQATLNASPVSLSIGNEITAIKGLSVSAKNIYCHATVPPICDNESFLDYDAVLHVPATSLAAYFTAPYWCNFSDIRGDVDNVEPPILIMSTDSLTVAPFVRIDNYISCNYFANYYPTNDYIIEHQYDYNPYDYSSVSYYISKYPGECDFIAYSGDLYTYCHIKVVEVYPKIIQDTLQLRLFEHSNLTINMQPDNIIYDENQFYYFSTNNDVARVENGIVTAVAPGECDIIVSYGYYDEYNYGHEYYYADTCHVIVNEPVVQISLDQNEASVLPNHIITLTPTMTPITTELVVASSNPAVAAARMINDKIQVVGISEGETTITVSSSDGLAIPGTCLVTVYTEVCDVDCDGYITINDVSLLIDYLLNGDDSSIKLLNADVDADGEVSISDVGELIDMLLSI